jgi:hypothetical protein
MVRRERRAAGGDRLTVGGAPPILRSRMTTIATPRVPSLGLLVLALPGLPGAPAV